MGNRYSRKKYFGEKIHELCKYFFCGNICDNVYNRYNTYVKDCEVVISHGILPMEYFSDLNTASVFIILNNAKYIPYDPQTKAISSFIYQYMISNEYIIHAIDLYKPTVNAIAIHTGRILVTSHGNCIQCDIGDELKYWDVKRIYEHKGEQLTNGVIEFIKELKYTTEFPLEMYKNAICEMEYAQRKIKRKMIQNNII